MTTIDVLETFQMWLDKVKYMGLLNELGIEYESSIIA